LFHRLCESAITGTFIEEEYVIRIAPESSGYTWGSTSEERSAHYPCDRHLPDPDDTLFRALTVQRNRDVVFRWLCQLRVAPYSYDWIDNCGHRSPRDLLPGLDKLEAGQRFMEIFELINFEPNGHITLKMDHAGARRIFGEIVCSYAVKSVTPSKTRLIVKLLVRRTTHRRYMWVGPLLPWGDLLMMRKQLLTLRELAERPE
jgi:hypothetical protein